MLTEEIADPGATSPSELREEYLAAVARAIADVGAERVAADTDLPPARVDAIAAGTAGAVTLEETAAVLACAPDYPAADDYLLELRDHLMLEMSSAVVDVDDLTRGIESDLDPKEIQQKVEGRRGMTLSEYARIAHYLASENPW